MEKKITTINHDKNAMSLIDHLAELRKRLLYSLYALLLTSGVSLVFCKKIYHILQIPMIKVLPANSTFIATTPFESYKTYFKISLLAGFFAATPFIFYNFWRFISPALHKNEKRYIIPFTLCSVLLFTGGALFGYFIVFPAGFYYVNLILQDTSIQLMPRMLDYLDVASTLLLAFGVTFELPLLIFFLGKLGLIQYQHIKHYRRYIIVCLFIIAAILTPGPDVLSQCLLAIPLWILYELGGLSLKMMGKKGEKNY